MWRIRQQAVEITTLTKLINDKAEWLLVEHIQYLNRVLTLNQPLTLYLMLKHSLLLLRLE